MRLIEYKFPGEDGKRFKVVQTEQGEVQIVYVYAPESDVWIQFDRK